MLLVDNASSCGPAPNGPSLSGCTSAQQLPAVIVSNAVGASIKTAMASGTVNAVPTFNIYNTNPPWGTLDGTSMATPHVSAATAVVWAARPKCPANVVRQVIKDTATKPANLFPNGRTCNAQVGCGIINIPAAIDAILVLPSASCP
jgi:subtilisin family serine protease